MSTDELFRAYARRVARLVLRFGAAPVDVDDLVQDVFLVVARSGPFETQGTAAPMTWLTAITMRVMANHRRARRRKLARQAPLTAEPVHHQSSPTELVYADQRREILMQALDALPTHQRDLIVLFELEGHGCLEIARMLDTKPSAVHSRLSRARKTLRKRLEEIAGPQILEAGALFEGVR